MEKEREDKKNIPEALPDEGGLEKFWKEWREKHPRTVYPQLLHSFFYEYARKEGRIREIASKRELSPYETKKRLENISELIRKLERYNAGIVDDELLHEAERFIVVDDVRGRKFEVTVEYYGASPHVVVLREPEDC